MNNQKDSNRITIITLAATFIGFLTWIHHPIYSILFLGIILLPKFITISQLHSWIAIASLTTTTFIFGLINGWTFKLLNEYFQTQQQNKQLPIYSIYLSLLTVYHYFQFQLVNNFHHKTLEWKSFLIYHSKSYTIANTFSIIQHLLTRYAFQFQYKTYNKLMIPALVVAIIGQSLRIAAFFTCKSNFTHLVRFSKVKGHNLITHGIYSYLRHPSYTGFFYFSVFSQLYLGNFLSFVLFAIVLRKFFQERIDFQQQNLLQFFPQYLEYKKRTHIFIPFVKDPNFYQKYGFSEQQYKQNEIKKHPKVVLSTDTYFNPYQSDKTTRQTANQYVSTKKND